MKNIWVMRFGAVVIGISAGTCGPSDGSSAEAWCRDSAEQAPKNAETLCPCLVEDGTYPDKQSCIDDLTFDESYYDCICPLYNKYPALSAYIDCIAPSQETLADCVQSAGCDPDKRDACFDALLNDLSACEVSPEAEAEQEAFDAEIAEKCGPLIP
jgi:hypothetical protein